MKALVNIWSGEDLSMMKIKSKEENMEFYPLEIKAF